MRLSVSIEIAMQLAAQEAIAAEFKDIEPEHLLEAILKFSEIPENELEKISPSANAAKELTREAVALRSELKARAVDSTRVRHELRSDLKRGDQQYDGGRMHRSEATRRIFDAAARLAEEGAGGVLSVTHLLDALMSAPTEVMAKVLGGAVGSPSSRRVKTPLIDQYGKDLTSPGVASGKVANVQAECRALVQALSLKRRRSVLLIGTSDILAGAVVRAAIARGNLPGAKDRRVVDLTALKPAGKSGQEAIMKLNQMLAEAAGKPDVILFLPPIELPQGIEKEDRWLNSLKANLVKRSVQCICRVHPAAYEKWVKPDSTWKRLAQSIWISESKKGGIPSEL